MNRNIFQKIEVYEKKKIKKNIFFNFELRDLTKNHFKNSIEYKILLKKENYNLNNLKIEKFPFLPVSLFKELNLKSIKDKDIFRVLTSSGTSGSTPSKIFLDIKNAKMQTLVLSKIMSRILGNKRVPMLIIDCDPMINKNTFSARIAAINGFSIFGKDHVFALDKNYKIKKNILQKFLNKNKNESFFVFGFTSLIYEYFLNSLKKKYDFSNAILLHGGGWKKMIDKKIENAIFKKKLKEKFKFKKIVNYYGLVEQTGSIFLECEKCSNFVTSNYSDVLIRDKNFKILKKGEQGMIQLLSLLPSSYPGHSILTEDVGAIIDNKDCVCGNYGKAFKVYGRLKDIEIRGCSDTI